MLDGEKITRSSAYIRWLIKEINQGVAYTTTSSTRGQSNTHSCSTLGRLALRPTFHSHNFDVHDCCPFSDQSKRANGRPATWLYLPRADPLQSHEAFFTYQLSFDSVTVTWYILFTSYEAMHGHNPLWWVTALQLFVSCLAANRFWLDLVVHLKHECLDVCQNCLLTRRSTGSLRSVLSVFPVHAAFPRS